MGLFDFLHGNPPKSEAQAYMEKRNKEYTRRAAEYKRREALQELNASNKLFDNLKNRTNTNVHKNSITTNVVSCLKTAVDKTVSFAESSNALNAARPKKPCDSCDSVPSIYDGAEKDLFEVSAASVQFSLRNVIASGVVRRGGFSVGDKVIIQTLSETKEVTISGIWRQGEKAQYVNVSSGQVGLVLANAADVIVKSGSKIIKY